MDKPRLSGLHVAMAIALLSGGCVLFQEGPYTRVLGPIDGVEVVAYHNETLGWSDYLANNTTPERKCYRLRHGDTDTGWHDLQPLTPGRKYATGKQFIRLNNRYNFYDKSIRLTSFSGPVAVMPYPRIGTCAAYNGVVEINSVTRQWFFDADKVATMLQRPLIEVQSELTQKGLSPLTPVTQATSGLTSPVPSAPVPQTMPSVATQTPSPVASHKPPFSIIGDMERGWRGMPWGISLSEFKMRFPKHSQETTWWITGEGIEEFAGLWMKTRYGFNKHERLSTVQFLPNQEDQSRVVEALVAAIGQPTSEKEGNRFWNLPSHNVSVASIFGNKMIVVQHGPLSKD